MLFSAADTSRPIQAVMIAMTFQPLVLFTKCTQVLHIPVKLI